MNAIELRPIGNVCSEESCTEEISLQGSRAVIEIFPEYAAALDRIDENSHLWILSWFHEARRDVLATSPKRVNPDLPVYGVFALRTPSRPNPIGLSLVRLEAVAGNRLFVSGLDAVNGTAVLDIKPYYEHDIVFFAPHPRNPADKQADEERSSGKGSLFPSPGDLHRPAGCGANGLGRSGEMGQIE